MLWIGGVATASVLEAQTPRVDLWWPRDVARGLRVVTVGLFFPKGSLSGEGEALRAIGGGGGICQVRPLVRHADGSIARAAVSFTCRPRPRGVQKIRFRVGAAPKSPTPGRRLEALREDEALVVNAEDFRFEVDVEGGLPRGRLLGRSGSPPMGVSATLDGEGVEGPPRLSFEETGPLRAVIVCRGRFRPKEFSADVDYVQRWTVTCCAADVTVETWFPAAARIDPRVPLWLKVRSGSSLRGLTFGGARARVSRRRLPLRLEADDRLGLVLRPDFEGAPDREDLRPAVAWRTRAGGFHLAQREFTRMTPSALSVDEGGTIRSLLVGADYHWYPGVRPGRAVRISMSNSRRGLEAKPWTEPVILPVIEAEPLLRGIRIPGRVGSTGRVLAPLERVLTPWLPNGSIPGPDWVWPGEENLGDWRWSRSDAGNLEYDTSLGFLAWGARHRSPAQAAWAVTAARHLVQRDLDRWPLGLPLRHGRYHRSGVVEVGHLWFEGLLAVAGTTADGFLLEELEKVTEAFCKRQGERIPRRTLMRCLGWGTLAAAALNGWYGDERTERRLEAYRRAFLEAPGAATPLVEPMRGEAGLFRVSPWVAQGILAPALLRADELAPDSAVAARVRRMSDELIEEAWEEDTGRLYGRLVVDESGRIVKKDGASPGEEMLFFAVGLLAAETLTGVKSYGATARRVATQAWSRLRLAGKTYRGMDISQLLWCAARLP